MPRMSMKVKMHQPKSKKSCPTMMMTYEAIEEAKDVLFNIHACNKSWGIEWYECVSVGFYKSALRIVEHVAKGESFIIAVATLNELIDLSNHMHELEEGGIEQ